MPQLLDLNGLTKYTELVEKMIDDKLSQLGSGIPSGVICIWSGAVADIPDGWALCDGSNGTSDLRDKFIVGAGNSYSVNASGGSSSQSVSVSISSTTGATTLTVDQIPSHRHGIANNMQGLSDSDQSSINIISAATGKNSANTGGGGSHTHSLSGSGTANVSILPPYYAKCYIQKL